MTLKQNGKVPTEKSLGSNDSSFGTFMAAHLLRRVKSLVGQANVAI
jgi:hypothetical protein